MCDLLCCFGCLTLVGVRDRICQKLVYFPPKPMYLIEQSPDDDSALMYMLDSEERRCDPVRLQCAMLKTRRGQTIATMFLPSPGSKTIMIYSHGNATDLGLMRDHLLDVAKNLKIHIFAYDYTGYGCSTGFPTPANTYADAEAAFNHVRTTWPQHRIILYGQSLGSGLSFHLGALFPDDVHGIVIHSGLLSGLRVIRENPTPKSLWFDIYTNINLAAETEAPVFIIHGDQDEDVPINHGTGLAAHAKYCYEPWFVEGAGHNNIEAYWRTSLFERLRNFILDVEAGKAKAKCRRGGGEGGDANGSKDYAKFSEKEGTEMVSLHF